MPREIFRKINIKHNDEIGRLSDSLDYMAAEINSLNEYQKNLLPTYPMISVHR